MTDRPWMPLYVPDYLADTGHMSTVEHGAYLLLIMHYWQNDGLPTDDKRLARIARLTPDEWTDVREVIAEHFDGGWHHKRIDAEIAKASQVMSKRRAAGKAGASARYGKRIDVPKQTHGPSQPPSPVKTKPIGFGKKDGCRIPEDFKPDPAEAQALGLPLALALSEAERFKDYWIGVPGQRGRKRDWPATWRNWCRKVADDKGLTPKSQANDNEDWTWINGDDPEWDSWARSEERETGKRPVPGLGRNGHGNWFEARFRPRPAA